MTTVEKIILLPIKITTGFTLTLVRVTTIRTPKIKKIIPQLLELIKPRRQHHNKF
jgi:hypothetical protein